MKAPFSDLGLALRGKKISDFSTLGLKSLFFDLGLALRGKKLGLFNLGFEKSLPGETDSRRFAYLNRFTDSVQKGSNRF